MGGSFVVGSHHLAREMAQMKHCVTHISTPVTLAHLLKHSDEMATGRLATWWRGGVRKSPNLIDYVPLALVPWPIARIAVRSGRNPFLTCMPPISTVLRRIGFSSVDLLYIDQPRFFGLEEVICPRASIYRATDLYEEFEKDPAMGVVERRMVVKADGLVGTSEPVLDRLRMWSPEKPSLLLSNGVDYEHFSRPASAPPEYEDIGRPRLVYIGSLDERFDIVALRALAQRLPHANIVLVGPPNRRVAQAVSRLPNIHLLGSRAYDLLPMYLQHSDVGLLPLSDHPANVGRSPMKLFEYAAAGLPIVAKTTPVLSQIRIPHMLTYQTSEELGSVVASALQWGDSSANRMYAASESWSSKATTLLRFALDILAEKGAK